MVSMDKIKQKICRNSRQIYSCWSTIVFSFLANKYIQYCYYFTLWIESLKSDDHQFHQYQQNEQTFKLLKIIYNMLAFFDGLPVQVRYIICLKSLLFLCHFFWNIIINLTRYYMDVKQDESKTIWYMVVNQKLRNTFIAVLDLTVTVGSPLMRMDYIYEKLVLYFHTHRSNSFRFFLYTSYNEVC